MTDDTLALVVDRLVEVAPGIRGVVLRRPDRTDLPSFVPGSHLVVSCGGSTNAYSLTGDGALPDVYSLSVRLDPGGRGGSQWIHRLRPGDRVSCRGPRTAFAPIPTARHHLMVAGGIGITPFLSHLHAARAWGRSASLIYAVGRGVPIPHRDELETLIGGRMRIVQGRETLDEVLRSELERQPLGTHLYVCGPGGMIDAVMAIARDLGWPEARCHAERFGGVETGPGLPFTVHLRRSGKTLDVPADQSLLDALASAGVAWPAMCRRGVCGECRMKGAEGTLLHHDLVLSPTERADGTCLMHCVSRAHGVLTLDL